MPCRHADHLWAMERCAPAPERLLFDYLIDFVLRTSMVDASSQRWLTKLTNPAYSAPMAAYNIYEAKTRFSALVDKAVSGEEVIIARAGKPVLKLVPVCSDTQKKHRRPAPGSLGGGFSDLLKALDEPWSEEEQRAFGMID